MTAQLAAYQLLHDAVSPVVEHYRDDLEKYDRQAIEEHPEWPYLHFAGEMGTYILQLWPAAEYPAAGVYVPYLFSVADREHLLREKRSMVAACQRNSRPVVHCWDGRHLRQIDYPSAEKIVRDYERRIRAAWRGGEA